MNFVELGLQKLVCTLLFLLPPFHLEVVASFKRLELDVELDDLGLRRVWL